MNAVSVCRRRARRPCRLPSRDYPALTADGVEIFPIESLYRFKSIYAAALSLHQVEIREPQRRRVGQIVPA